MAYEYIDGVGGDAALRATGLTLALALADAARGLSAMFADPSEVHIKRTAWVDVAPGEPGDQAVEFLGEIVYLFDAEGFVAGDVRVGPAGAGGFRAELRGEAYDPARHTTRAAVKAVTYHALDVSQSNGGWAVRVTFDL
jgi:SHS2 domain-containing protein